MGRRGLLEQRVPSCAGPTEGVLPHLHSALASRVVVEQAKGFQRERLNISVADAFGLLRR